MKAKLKEAKKIVPLSVKISLPIDSLLESVCQKEDRGRSYIVRELMLRGLALYIGDRQLKPTEAEEQSLEQMAENIARSKS